MTKGPQPAATATVAVRVGVVPEIAFAVFTREIDRWWRRGPKFRHAGESGGTIHIEPGLGGCVIECWRDANGEHSFELGRITVWEPQLRLRFGWRNATFTEVERTEVEVTFVAQTTGTLVTVRHFGWEALRQDHPARHGQGDVGLARLVGIWWGEQLTALRHCVTGRVE